MMVRFTPEARDDIERIYRSIFAQNPIAAQQVEDRIRSASDGLAEFPGVGAQTDIPDVRRLPLVRYPYAIYYRTVALEDAVDILRVVHASLIKNLRQLPD